MATESSLGKLVVSIVTDLNGLNEGLKSAEKSVKDTSGKITELTTKIGKTLTVAGAAITGTFALMAKSVVDYNEEIYRMSEQTGLSVETLSRLKYVAEQNESSFEAVAIGIKYLSKNLYEAASGSDEARGKFESLGVSVKNADGSVRNAEEVFYELADRFASMKNATEKSALALQVFGRQGTSLIPVLNLGSEGLRKAAEQADRLGITLTSANAKALDEFGDNVNNIKQALLGLWIEIVNNLTPALTDLAEGFTELLVKIREFAQEHPALTEFAVTAVVSFGALALAIGPLLIALPQMAASMAIISKWAAAMGIGLGALTLEFTAMAAAVLSVVYALNQLKQANDAVKSAQDAQRYSLELGIKYTEKIKKNLDDNIVSVDNLTTSEKLSVEALRDKIDNYELYAQSLLNKKKIDEQDYNIMMDKLKVIREMSVALGELTRTQNAATTETTGTGTTGISDISDIDLINQITSQSTSEMISNLRSQYEDYYNRLMELRQVDIDDVLVKIQEQLNDETLSTEQRKALQETYYNYLYNKRIQDANTAHQITNQISSTISSNLASALMGVQSFSDAWKNIWTSLGTYLIQQVLQKIIDKLLELIGLEQLLTAAFSLVGFQTGGMMTASGNKVQLPSADEGLYVSGPPGPMPIMIHPPEVITPYDKFMNLINGGGSNGGVNVSFYNYGAINSDVDISDLMTKLGDTVKKATRE